MAHLESSKVLMVYPRFNAATFWNFSIVCELFDAKYMMPPLGLITVAALLPSHWDIRLVDRNIEELTPADLDWADLVMTGGMLPQQFNMLEVIALSHEYGKPVVVGGPDPTSSPDLYAAADFQVLGEAEGIIDEFIAAWEAGARSGRFTAPKFTIDVTTSPIPRFDLLKLESYMYVGVQYSRGCPFTCEFCDIIELYGRVPRAKTTPQMLAELEALYQLGYRGHVDFLDDNLIGNKKSLKLFLPELAVWLKARDYPFEFSTEASINMADDDELLRMLGEANFFTVFVGIESPDPKNLVHTKKKQNTRRSLVGSVHKIYRAGMFVTAGFIIGFDTEEVSMADAMADFIEEAAIPVSMIGLLYAAPTTQLTRRLAAEGRLHDGNGVALPEGTESDHCTATMNFDPLRPLSEILRDYRRVLERVYDPVAFAGRLERLAGLLDRSGRPRHLPPGDKRLKATLGMAYEIIGRSPEAREPFLRAFAKCNQSNPAALRIVVTLMTLYLHLGPYARKLIATIDAKLVELDLEAASGVGNGRAGHGFPVPHGDLMPMSMPSGHAAG